MDLNWVKLTGYKRFENATLNTSGKVVAIVGPNEAGKSSLLQALEHLNHDNEFTTQEITRDQEIQDNAVILEAGFILDEHDHQAIFDLYGGDHIQWFKVCKLKNGNKKYEVQTPLVPPSIVHRETIKSLDWAVRNLPLEKMEIDAQLLEELHFALKAANKSFDQNLIRKFQDFISQIFSPSSLKRHPYRSLHKFGIDIDTALLKELQQCLYDYLTPHEKVIEILKNRTPQVLLFNEPQRNLLPSYDLTRQLKTRIDPALQNLLINLANLDLAVLNDAMTPINPAKLKKLEQEVNQKIAKVIEGKWSQSGINLSLDINQNLNILIEDEYGEFTNFQERSDGLRQFVALIAFLECQKTENDLSKPILLIDEAEIHLHYDGQADLMKMFAKQQLVSKIIYTTHSAGCLPEDIGVGVKVVEPILGQERSKINNCFWKDSEKGFGFAPLLFGMGGSTLAYVPIRKAVFVEGITDLILLPTLFREVTKKDYLGFQVIPGLSQVSPQSISLIENHAPSSVFLFDADQAGNQYIKDFQKFGIDESRLVQLPLGDSGEVLEDCIKEDLYLEVVNQQLQIWCKDSTRLLPQITLSDISGKNCPNLVKQWCRSQGIAKPEKREIAYRLIQLSTDRQETLLRPELEQPFQELYEKISESLDL